MRRNSPYMHGFLRTCTDVNLGLTKIHRLRLWNTHQYACQWKIAFIFELSFESFYSCIFTPQVNTLSISKSADLESVATSIEAVVWMVKANQTSVPDIFWLCTQLLQFSLESSHLFLPVDLCSMRLSGASTGNTAASHTHTHTHTLLWSLTFGACHRWCSTYILIISQGKPLHFNHPEATGAICAGLPWQLEADSQSSSMCLILVLGRCRLWCSTFITHGKV